MAKFITVLPLHPQESYSPRFAQFYPLESDEALDEKNGSKRE
jgi:hypothetical protein